MNLGAILGKMRAVIAERERKEEADSAGLKLAAFQNRGPAAIPADERPAEEAAVHVPIADSAPALSPRRQARAQWVAEGAQTKQESPAETVERINEGYRQNARGAHAEMERRWDEDWDIY